MNGAFGLAGHLGLSSPDKPFLAQSGRSVGPLDQIDALADHGFKGVQDLFLKLRPHAQCDAMANKMAARGLALASFGGDPALWNTPLWSSDDREAQRDSVRASAQVARRFGGGSAVCVAGVDPDRSITAQLRDMAANLGRVAEQAGEAQLTLLVEPIASQRITGMLLDRLEMAEDVVRAVDMPSVRLMFDIGHVAMMGHDVAQALTACSDIIGLVQAADVQGHERVAPGRGTLDWIAIVRAITQIGYGGLIELEFEPLAATVGNEADMLDGVASALRPGRREL